MSEIELINNIRNGDKAALKEIYIAHKSAFIGFLIKHYQANQEVALEVYQFTILRFYDNIVQGKLTELTSTLKSYLFSIGKNIWKEQVRARQKTNASKDELLFRFALSESDQELNEAELVKKERYYKKMAAALIKLGNPCKQVLEYFYYEKWSMQQIADALGFKNTNVAKTKKNKCLKRLKSLVLTDKITLQNG